ncbi:MAG: 16S rRNA (adenine(1518)-N(6)/adenine(1519)-N(6))-dimethyltransferase RsmA [Candidatus Delongbacteria bacterium]|jgi:16S rRNA (adenine1518-N6/adenine1519-N6)-dimethyltransferase|nr:16S rRNA (adenine(1518)-N(6)/adenine(1519)-N(6))-dimethyltransferase RsmA [Candidatus Delongbacteria bacterium]
MVKPKKHLGQHFLTDRHTADKICNALVNKDDWPVLEIGPGKGVLTKKLMESHNEFFAVETDEEAVDYLNDLFPELDNRLIKKDLLVLDLTKIASGKLCIISNLPYNISSPVLFKVLENRNLVDEAVFMMQREVARRIASPHGTKVYGILSVLIQAYYDVEYLFTVNEGVFFPKPKVKSGVVRLVRNAEKDQPDDYKFFKHLVKAAFNQRRKTLRNSLKSILSTFPAQDATWLGLRPEQCSVQDFIEIARQVQNQK